MHAHQISTRLVMFFRDAYSSVDCTSLAASCACAKPAVSMRGAMESYCKCKCPTTAWTACPWRHPVGEALTVLLDLTNKGPLLSDRNLHCATHLRQHPVSKYLAVSL
eukprot:1160914-Pelagomonas_calceolata.AAC.23